MPSPPLDVRYLDVTDYLYLAGAALNVAPAATFAAVEFYPDLVTKAAVPVTCLAKNHPLPTATSALPTSPWWSSWRATDGGSWPRTWTRPST